VKLVKFILAVFLLPSLAAVGWWLVEIVRLHAQRWQEIPWLNLGCFATGFSLMVCVYFFLPRWNWLYVFGHEATHALAVVLSGGKVSGFKVSGGGGHVVSDKISVWIALSPYIVPFYPLTVGAAWFAARWVWPAPLTVWESAFVVVWGMAWAFHLCFTVSLLKTDQPDFASQGWFFSIVVILSGNLLIVSVLLWLWLEPGAWRDGLSGLWHCWRESYEFCAARLAALYRLAF
jgi:hypothetical protein